jgi:hypothetical protein
MFGFFSWFKRELVKAIRGAFEEVSADGAPVPLGPPAPPAPALPAADEPEGADGPPAQSAPQTRKGQTRR